MIGNSSDPATQGDVRYLAELITQNAVRIDGLEGRMDGLDGRMDGLDARMDALERTVCSLAEIMERGFADLKKMINGIGKQLSRDADLLEDHEGRIRILEKAA